MLNILEPFQLKEWGHNTANTIHIMAETMKLAYADRSKYLGDVVNLMRSPLKKECLVP